MCLIRHLIATVLALILVPGFTASPALADAQKVSTFEGGFAPGEKLAAIQLKILSCRGR